MYPVSRAFFSVCFLSCKRHSHGRHLRRLACLCSHILRVYRNFQSKQAISITLYYLGDMQIIINVLACGLVFLHLIGFFLATQKHSRNNSGVLGFPGPTVIEKGKRCSNFSFL